MIMSKLKITKTNIIVTVLTLMLLISIFKFVSLELEITKLKQSLASLEEENINLETKEPSVVECPSDPIEIPQRAKEEKYDVLKKLSTEVQIFYFNKLLGNPVFINLVGEKKEIKEYVYVDEDFFVQAITDGNDKVLNYAVTSRKKDFNPTFGRGGLFMVSLNKTPFSEWRIDPYREFPLTCWKYVGAHDPIYYFESEYFGNPGNYLTFLVGVNNSATFDDLPRHGDGEISGWGKIECEDVNKEDRAKMSPNTFIVQSDSIYFGSVIDLDDGPSVWFGPNNIQTRTLNE